MLPSSDRVDERGSPTPRAVLIERNKLVSRRLVRYMTCAGLEPVALEDPAELRKHLDGAFLVAGDAFDAEQIAEALRVKPKLRSVLWTAEPVQRSLRYMTTFAGMSNVLGRPDFDTPPRGWELMMVLRRLLRPADEPPKFAWYLDWGFTGFQERITDSACRDRIVDKVQRFASHIGVRKAVADQFGELAYELIMNAMYGAPIDRQGRPKYAADRKANLVLPNDEQPILRLASDGARLAIQVSDPFGGLLRKHVFDGLQRGLAGGQMDRSHGGAGLGMTICHNATAAMFYDVTTGKRSDVTGLIDLEMNQRDFKTQPKSLHFFSA
jgi:hypothetical protein